MTVFTDPFIKNLQTWGLDTIERAMKTFGQVFGAQLVSSGFLSIDHVTNLSLLQRCAVAGLSAGLSVISSAVSSLKGPPGTASLFPANVVPPVEPAVPTEADLGLARAAIYEDWKAGTISWDQVQERLGALHV